jgi:hypothetical protein
MATVVPERYKKWQRDESNAAQSRAGGAFTTAFSFQAEPLQAGDYKVSASFELRLVSPGANTLAQAQVLVNGNLKSDHAHYGEEWDRKTAWDFQTFPDGATPTVRIDFKRTNAGGTVEIRKMKISVERKKD